MTKLTKSTTCFGAHGALTVYFSRSTAQRAATHQAERCGREFAEYKCHNCGRWHISPVNSGSKDNTCGCTDSNGYLKPLYSSREEAVNAANSAYRKKGIQLYVYQCEHYHGWHLTASPY